MTEQSSKKNINSGHRARLRNRFLVNEGRDFEDYELLELLLMQAVARQDVKPLAKSLLVRFGSFKKVVNADIDELRHINGVGDAVITILKVIKAGGIRILQQDIEKTHILGSWDKLLDYLLAEMGSKTIEESRILYLNARNYLIRDEVHRQGSVSHTPLYQEEIIRRALSLRASALIIVHNHPSGNSTPSGADIEMTKQIRLALQAVNLILHDHLIVTQIDIFSFRNHGLL